MGARRKAPSHQPPVEKRDLRLGRVLGGVLVFSVLAGVCGYGGWWLMQPTSLPIQRVQVEGEFRYLSKEDLYQAIGDLSTGGFFNIDVRAVKEAAESLPWVDTASVRRQWPDSLKVAITEQTPLARWNEQQVVNVRGELFAPPLRGLSSELPHFYGPEGSSVTVASHYQVLAARLATAGLQVEVLRLSERRAWSVTLQQGLQLVLGRDPQDMQLQRFIEVYPRLGQSADRQLEMVDLRYSNGFAARWKTAAGNRAGI